MTDTIMVAVDGEPGHRAAVGWAASRAARDGARLELVLVVEGGGPATEELGRALTRAAEGVLDAERRMVAEPAAGVAIGTRVLHGHVSAELAEASADAALLVVGAPSGEARRRAFAGSLAVRVASMAECPVAVVPHGWEGPGTGVVVGVDGERPAELAVAFAADEAAALGEELTVVCAGYTANPLLAGFVPEITLGDRRERALSAAAAQARELRPDLLVRTELIEDAPARGLVTASEGSRMLVLGTRGRRGAKRVMLGSVGHDVLLNLRCPVVIARGAADRGAADRGTADRGAEARTAAAGSAQSGASGS